MSELDTSGSPARWRPRGGPLLHFLLLGGLLFVATRYFVDAPTEPDVTISARDIESLDQDWRRRAGRAPTPAELQRMIQRRVDEELLLQQAFSLGWSRTDGVAVRRLIQNQRFLDPESEADDAAMLERAYAQGMDRSDIVVRRRLLERMRLTIGEVARREEPDDAKLQAHLDAQASHYTRPESIRVTHIFLSRDRRGEKLGEDVSRMAERIEREAPAPSDAVAWSDPLLIANDLPLWSEDQIARRLGPDFARGAFEAALQSWTGPVSSSYGVHFVWLHERIPASLAELDEVRAEVRGAVLEQREREAIEQHVAELRNTALIEIEDVSTQSETLQ